MTRIKKFSLALWWWAARWIAHVGVVKRLEEIWVSPVAVSGTSMGSIVWALLALGKTSSQMQEIAKNIPFFKLVESWGSLGLLKWTRVEKYLDELFEWKEFSQTQIPLSITATDIDTGERVIFTQWKISQAVRASISLPGIFYPKEIDWRSLVDWGLANNLPIELLPGWKVIAVSALRDIHRKIPKKRTVFGIEWKKSIFWNTYDIIQKTIDIMLSQNEQRSVTSRKDVLYLRPQFDNLDYYDFLKYDDFIKAGYESTQEIWKFIWL